MRDYRLRHLIIFFIYSGFEVVFLCTGFALVCELEAMILSSHEVGGIFQAWHKGNWITLTNLLFSAHPQSYGVCSIGLENVAYIITAYGLSAAVCSSLALSMLCVPRQVPLLTGASVHAILLIALFCWEPRPRSLAEAPMLYLVAALWGLGSALNKTGLSCEYNFCERFQP